MQTEGCPASSLPVGDIEKASRQAKLDIETLVCRESNCHQPLITGILCTYPLAGDERGVSHGDLYHITEESNTMGIMIQGNGPGTTMP